MASLLDKKVMNEINVATKKEWEEVPDCDGRVVVLRNGNGSGSNSYPTHTRLVCCGYGFEKNGSRFRYMY